MSTSKIGTIAVVIILVLIGGYWAYGFFGSSNSSPSGVSVSSGSADQSQNTATGATSAPTINDPFISLLNSIQQVNLKQTSLLNNPIFETKLVDVSKPVGDLGRGRANPFAPIGAGGNYDAESGSVASVPIMPTTFATTSASTTVPTKTTTKPTTSTKAKPLGTDNTIGTESTSTANN